MVVVNYQKPLQRFIRTPLICVRIVAHHRYHSPNQRVQQRITQRIQKRGLKSRSEYLDIIIRMCTLNFRLNLDHLNV